MAEEIADESERDVEVLRDLAENEGHFNLSALARSSLRQAEAIEALEKRVEQMDRVHARNQAEHAKIFEALPQFGPDATGRAWWDYVNRTWIPGAPLPESENLRASSVLPDQQEIAGQLYDVFRAVVADAEIRHPTHAMKELLAKLPIGGSLIVVPKGASEGERVARFEVEVVTGPHDDLMGETGHWVMLTVDRELPLFGTPWRDRETAEAEARSLLAALSSAPPASHEAPSVSQASEDAVEP